MSRAKLNERQITHAAHGHILTNVNVFSPDGKSIVYDVRSDPAGAKFDGDRIEIVNIATRQVTRLYQSQNGAHCGVATFNPAKNQIAFILGPENPTADWQYAANKRRGAIVNVNRPGVAMNLDARKLSPPFKPGALRGGSHVHVFSPDGRRVSFTYNDFIASTCTDQRNVGMSVMDRPIEVSRNHPRNHDGAFSVLISRTTATPTLGSDEIRRAFEDAWVGNRAIAFQGEVISESGAAISEVFIVDLPDDLSRAGDEPIEGSATNLPAPPRGVVQRRLTRTANRRFPGVQGPRHWVHSSPDGSRIAFLIKDDDGIVQIWVISPSGESPTQVTRNKFSIASAFSWSFDGRFIAHAMDNSVCVTHAGTGETMRLTPRSSDADAPRPEACVFSPSGMEIAFVRNVAHESGGRFNQIFITSMDRPSPSS